MDKFIITIIVILAMLLTFGFSSMVVADIGNEQSNSHGQGEDKHKAVKPKSGVPVVVVNSPKVQAKQRGKWNVDVTGAVTVDNAPDNPIPVVTDPYPREVTQIQSGLINQTGFFVKVDLVSVPDDKRLVIEDLSWSVELRSEDPIVA